MKKVESEDRRVFIKHILVGTGAAAGIGAIVRPVKQNSAGKPVESDEVLYHESEEFEKYYETLRS